MLAVAVATIPIIFSIALSNIQTVYWFNLNNLPYVTEASISRYGTTVLFLMSAEYSVVM